MALTRTADVLTTMVRNRADHLVGTFRADTVLYQYLSDSCRSLVSMLVEEYGETYWVSETFINTTADVFATDAPADMWKLVTLRLSIDGTRDRMTRADLDEIDREAVGLSLGGWSAGRWPRYRLMQRRFYWTPTPRAVHQVKVYYVPTKIFADSGGTAKSDLTVSNDTFDGIFGWDKWVALDAAIKLLTDEKKDTSALALALATVEQEIRTAASNQGTDDPPKVRDRYGDEGEGWPSGRMPPGGWY